MKEIRMWIAEDGTKFDDAEECYFYERDLKLEEIKNNFLALNKNFQPVQDFIKNFDSVFYFYVKTNSTRDILEEIFFNEGIVCPWHNDDDYENKPRAWVYLNSVQDWMNLTVFEDLVKHAPDWLNEEIFKTFF